MGLVVGKLSSRAYLAGILMVWYVYFGPGLPVFGTWKNISTPIAEILKAMF